MDLLQAYGVIRPNEMIDEIEIADITIPFTVKLNKEVKQTKIDGT